MQTIDKIIERLIIASGAKNQSEMLRIIGFSSATASSWKNRGEIPQGSLKRAAITCNVNFDWLMTGEGEMKSTGQSVLLDRELMQEAIITIGIVEDELGIKLKPEKRAELVMMIYDEYAAGVEVETAKVIQLVKLAA
jgi:hypothetical protein